MKVGDKVCSTKVRSGEVATITKADVKIKYRESKNGKKKEARTTYYAEFPDGSGFTFYGFNINKSVFKIIEPDGQINLSDFMNEPIPNNDI